MIRTAARLCIPLVAVLSLQLAGCSDDQTPSQGASTHSATPGASDDSTDPGAHEGGAPTKTGHAWTLLPDRDGGPLAAGRYGLTANGVSDHVAVVPAPAGYQHYGSWTFAAGEPFRAMGFVTADRVPPDPCGSWRHTGKLDAAVDPGPTVRDLADALVAQKGAATSDPAPVRVDDHRGLYLTYRVANGIDVSRCEQRAFDIFSTGPGAWYLEASRERASIWILDVDGERLVLAWVAAPGVPRLQMQEMTQMVQSTHFVASQDG